MNANLSLVRATISAAQKQIAQLREIGAKQIQKSLDRIASIVARALLLERRWPIPIGPPIEGEDLPFAEDEKKADDAIPWDDSWIDVGGEG